MISTPSKTNICFKLSRACFRSCRIDFQIAEIAAGLYGNLWAFLSLLMEMLTPENGEICLQIADCNQNRWFYFGLYCTAGSMLIVTWFNVRNSNSNNCWHRSYLRACLLWIKLARCPKTGLPSGNWTWLAGIYGLFTSMIFPANETSGPAASWVLTTNIAVWWLLHPVRTLAFEPPTPYIYIYIQYIYKIHDYIYIYIYIYIYFT